MKYLPIIIIVILGTIAYGQQETFREMWYLGCSYGFGICSSIIYIINFNK